MLKAKLHPQYLWDQQGSKNLFCVSRRIFLAGHRRHFSGRIFFHLGGNRAPSLKKLAAMKKKNPSFLIFEGTFCTHPNTNVINDMITSFFFNMFSLAAGQSGYYKVLSISTRTLFVKDSL